MCLIVFGINVHSDFPFILMGNRDEFYKRPTKNLFFWEQENFYAGKDLDAGGTWLAVAESGKFAALTNIRDPKNIKSTAISRGQIITDFMKSELSTDAFLNKLVENKANYNGFNLVCGYFDKPFFFNSLSEKIMPLQSGIYALSNDTLDSNWPKVITIKADFNKLIENNSIQRKDYQLIMCNKNYYDKKLLPNTGVGDEMEKLLSPIFIESPIYGTRSTTAIFLDNKNICTIIENDYLNQQDFRFDFKIK